MRIAFVALAVSVAPCGAELPKSESGPESPPRLQGTWEVKSVERDGKTLPPGELAGRTMSLTVTSGKMTLSVSGARAYLVEVGAGKTPTAIDFYSTSCVSIGKENGREVRREHAGKFLERVGIYALDGDTLRICVAGWGTGDERPTAFATAGKPGYELYILTRRE